MPSLVTRWAGTVARSGTVASVHALRIAQGRLAVLAHVTLRTDADLILVADALVGALFVTLGIGSFKFFFVWFRFGRFVSLRMVRFEHGVNHILWMCVLCVWLWMGVGCDGFGIHGDQITWSRLRFGRRLGKGVDRREIFENNFQPFGFDS